MIDNIIRKYQDRYIRKGSDFLLHPADALDFLEEVTAANIDILGIDLWTPVLVNGKEHLMEDSSVFLTHIENPHQVAKSFLTHHLPANITFVSFVLDE